MTDSLKRLHLAEAEILAIKAKTLAVESTLAGLRPLFEKENVEEIKEIEKIKEIKPAITPPPLPQKKAEPVEVTLPAKALPLPKKPREKKDFELEMGRVWFVRLGIMLLLTGVVFLGNYAYQNYISEFGAGARLALIYLGAFVVTGLGIFCERSRESLKTYGRTLASGGLAAVYYATFAAHNVTALKVIDSPVVGALLLGASALLFAGYALWRKSSGIMAAALGMAFYSTAINPVGWMACLSALILSTIGAVVCLRQRWTSVGVISLLASYGSFAWWQLAVGTANDATHWFLPAYWALFTALTFGKNFIEDHFNHSVFVGINNALLVGLFSLSLSLNGDQGDIWKLMAASGAIIGILSYFKAGAIRTGILAQGIGLLTLALILKLSGYQLFLVLLVEAISLSGIAIRKKLPVFFFFSGAAALLSACFTIEHLEVPVHIPVIAWSIAVALWLALGALVRHKQKGLITITGTATGVMATLTLIMGAFHGLEVETMTLTLVSLGLGASLFSRVKKLRLIGIEFLLGLQVICLGAGFQLLHLEDLHLYGLLLSLALLATSYWKSAALSEEEKLLQEPIKIIYLILATLFAGFLISQLDQDKEVHAALYTVIPLAAGFFARTISEKKFSWIPSALYLGLIPIFFVTGTTLSLVIATVGVGLNFVFSWKNKELREVLYILTVICVCSLSYVSLGYSASAIVISLIASTLGIVSHRIDIHSLSFVSFITAALAIFLACVAPRDQAAIYLTLIFPMVWGLWKNYCGDEHYSFLAIAMLSLIWQRLSHEFAISDAVIWAILGTISLGIGLVTRCRPFRYLALIILIASLGHVGLVDVWKLDPLPRILSLMSLGAGLLGLGFVYNRWHERLKHWL